ncbi:MAG: ATP-binding protein [Bacteroidales bacterium]|jgi:energy-coupling factor transporter ATP-binding protein EcfA2|nr:ATP-binding protein [Bacteroidales bacterium]
MKLTISNLGNITDSGEMNIKPVTVLCGDQGSGKSTILKLFSTFNWLEKALYREELKKDYVTRFNRFVKRYCSYHNIENYFKEDTSIKFVGNIYTFVYEKGKLNIKENNLNGKDVKIPQVMYVPAERNLIGAIKDSDEIGSLPFALLTMIKEYNNAAKSEGEMKFPFKNLSFHYDRLNKTSWILGNDFKIQLHEVASGIQSVTPLLLVTKYLSEKVNKTDLSKLSLEELDLLTKRMEFINTNKDIDATVRRLLVSKLNAFAHRNDYFINIVEEPEQNLFPKSQGLVLNELLSVVNKTKGNMLLFSTHSPYMISYLTLAIEAYQIASQSKVYDEERLNRIVPQSSRVNPDDVAIYQVSDEGKVDLLEMDLGLPIDDNFLNNQLAYTNDLFDDLLDIEENATKRN